ncbi:hypothetical protein VP01_2112g3 [Puccinia sorghi]|uniref:Uncharacterized protein n=1 Tax=Puccinia sorghi TaxID=27349 RepID=A0A0L6VA74_9BASI|nr:hypothetical protein VP01_2112g3 [Puccinia sorghi]
MVRGQKSTPAPEPPLPAPAVTPKRSVCASTSPPELTKPKPRNLKSVANLKLTKVPSPKQQPQQMQTGDFPPKQPRFNIVLQCMLCCHLIMLFLFFCAECAIHSCQGIMLLKQDSAPPAPDFQRLREFYECFSSNNQLFKTAGAGLVRYNQQFLHVGSINIRYAQGLMLTTISFILYSYQNSRRSRNKTERLLKKLNKREFPRTESV